MAEVVLAHRVGPAGFSRKVVLKRILPELAARADFMERFLREATLVAQLHHPNIIEVIELGTSQGLPYLVMEFLDGKTLRQIMTRLAARKLRCPPSIAVRVIAEVASALDHAHSHRDEAGEIHPIIHRDVAPDNIMLTYAGQVKLFDYGVAKDVMGDNLTRAGFVVGKPMYVPPEAYSNQPPDLSWDIYALGVVLYELLAGREPYTSGSGRGAGFPYLVNQVRTVVPPPLRSIDAAIPKALEHIVTEAMAKSSSERYRSARALLADLEGFLSSQPPISASALVQFLSELFDASGEPAAKARPAARNPPPRQRRSVGPIVLASASLAMAVGAGALVLKPYITRALERSGAPLDPLVVVSDRPSMVPFAEPREPVAQPSAEGGEILRPAAPATDPGEPQADSAPASPAPGQPVVGAAASPETPAPAAGAISGALVVSCDTWGWVRVDGRLIGPCPAGPIPMRAGRYTVTLEGLDDARAQDIDVAKGHTVTVHFRKPRPRAGPNVGRVVMPTQ